MPNRQRAVEKAIESVGNALRVLFSVMSEEMPHTVPTLLAAYRVWEELTRLMRIRGSNAVPLNYYVLSQRTGIVERDLKRLIDLLLALDVLRLVRPLDAFPGAPPVVAMCWWVPSEDIFVNYYRRLGCPVLRQISSNYLKRVLGEEEYKQIFTPKDFPEKVFGRDGWRDPRLPPPEDGEGEETDAPDLGPVRELPNDGEDDEDWAAV